MKQAPSVLLVIDMQLGAFDGVRLPPIYRADQLLAHAQQLVAAARAAQVPVVHVQHCDEAGQAFEQGTPHWHLHPHLTPQPGELVIQKIASSAFEGTGLQAKLSGLGTKTVVVCGLQSEFCVANTSKSALALGLQVWVAQDGHSTWPSRGRSAQDIADLVNQELYARGAALFTTQMLVERLLTAAAP